MHVKRAFLNGVIQEEVYVEQPLEFESTIFPYHIFKFYKALDGLKQAPRAWYEHLSHFLQPMALKEEKWIQICSTKTITQFILVQIYVGDIIFGNTNEPLCEDFSKLM